MYGPHIFHTDRKYVYEYLSRFSAFYPYSHRVLGQIDGKLVPIPFNFTSIEKLFPQNQAEKLKSELLEHFDPDSRVFVSDLLRHPVAEISALGQYIFEKVFRNYSAKQWGVPADSLDASVLRRVPVIIGKDDRYFPDSIQMMPIFGYTELFENMLRHPSISVHLNSDALKRVRPHAPSGKFLLDGVPFDGPVCFTGSIDELFDYALGALPYRSLELCLEDYPVDYYQNATVVNYPNEENFTRITEFKHMTLQDIPNATTIMKEYPIAFHPGGRMVPFYPIQTDENRSLYSDYLSLCGKYDRLYLCGRLAEYRYLNMDAVVDSALQVFEKIIRDRDYE